MNASSFLVLATLVSVRVTPASAQADGALVAPDEAKALAETPPAAADHDVVVESNSSETSPREEKHTRSPRDKGDERPEPLSASDPATNDSTSDNKAGRDGEQETRAEPGDARADQGAIEEPAAHAKIADVQSRDTERERRDALKKGKRYKKFGDPNPADATFLAGASAIGSIGGGAVVAATTGIVLYVGSTVIQWIPAQIIAEYWRWGLLGLVPIGISLFAIPVGAAFGTWWGAGLRGLPLSLNDALIIMGVGLLMGASAGVTVMTPIGMAGGMLFSVPSYLATGSSLRLGIGEQNLSRPVWSLVVVPAGITVIGVAVGAVVGGVMGPVITGSRWGYWAEGDYVE